MGKEGIRGIMRGKEHFTTQHDEDADRAADLVKGRFVASRRTSWVSDITYGNMVRPSPHTHRDVASRTHAPLGETAKSTGFEPTSERVAVEPVVESNRLSRLPDASLAGS